MAETEFIERMLSMLPEEFQDIYNDTIPEKGNAQEDGGSGEYIPEVIYVNGMRQYSASYRKYVSPKL